MLLIPCPYCGPRDETEFQCGGEADRKRPENPNNVDDTQWNDYLYNSTNPKGWGTEWWWHLYGCESWFQLKRNTVTHAISREGDQHS